MRLQQGQVWKVNDQFIRIVHLERLAVDYKVIKDLTTKEGTHHRATKKEFCRLIKQAVLQSASGEFSEPQPTDSAQPNEPSK